MLRLTTLVFSLFIGTVAFANGVKFYSLPSVPTLDLLNRVNCESTKCEIIRNEVKEAFVETTVNAALMDAIRLANSEVLGVKVLTPAQQALFGVQVSLVNFARKFEKVSKTRPGESKVCRIEIEESTYRTMSVVFDGLIVNGVLVEKLNRFQQAYLTLFLRSADTCVKDPILIINN